MTVSTNDILRFALTMAMPDSVVANMIFHYLAESGDPQTDSAVMNAVETHLQNAFNEIATGIESTADWDELYGWLYDFTAHQFDGIGINSVTISTTNAGEMLPHGAAMLFRQPCEIPRRQKRGYIPGWCENNMEEGIFNAASLLLGAACVSDLLDNVTVGTMTLTPVTFNVDSTSALYETHSKVGNVTFLDAVPGYQRRRRPGVGI